MTIKNAGTKGLSRILTTKVKQLLDFCRFGGEDEIRTRGRIAPTSV